MVSFTDDSGRLAGKKKGKGKENVTINRVAVFLSDTSKFLASYATIPLSGYAISEWVRHVDEVNDLEEEGAGRKRVLFFSACFFYIITVDLIDIGYLLSEMVSSFLGHGYPLSGMVS